MFCTKLILHIPTSQSNFGIDRNIYPTRSLLQEYQEVSRGRPSLVYVHLRFIGLTMPPHRYIGYLYIRRRDIWWHRDLDWADPHGIGNLVRGTVLMLKGGNAIVSDEMVQALVRNG